MTFSLRAENAQEVVTQYQQILINRDPESAETQKAAAEALYFLALGKRKTGEHYGITNKRPWAENEKKSYYCLIALAARSPQPIDFSPIMKKAATQWRTHAEKVQEIYWSKREMKEPFELKGLLPGYAFYVRNPNNPCQKILFVASRHSLPYKDLNNQPLVDKILTSDILVTEALTREDQKGLRSRDDVNIIDYNIVNTLKTWKINGYLCKEGFEIEGKPWYEALHKEGLDWEYFDKHIVAPLKSKSLPLAHVHPKAIVNLLEEAAQDKQRVFGMDSGLRQLFFHAGKTIKTLESWDAQPLEKGENYYSENPTTDPTEDEIKQVIAAFNNFKIMKPNQDAKELKEVEPEKWLQLVLAYIEEHPRIYQRNESWLVPLLDILAENPNQSVAIVVGNTHFPGERGLIKLLEKQGFEWRLFESGPFEE